MANNRLSLMKRFMNVASLAPFLFKAQRVPNPLRFTDSEMLLLTQFFRHQNDDNPINKSQFQDIIQNNFHIKDDLLLERIFKCFDENGDKFISKKEWLVGMSVFLRGTLQERIQFCFRIYDLNEDGYITADDLLPLLGNCFQKAPPEAELEEAAHELVELVVKKMDRDRDNKISTDDYINSVLREPLLLEAFGFCLPSNKVIKSFMDELARKNNED